MKRSRPTPRRRAQAGVALLEVLVSVLLFSLGLLGLIGLQARAISLSKSLTVPPATLTAWQARVADPTGGGLPAGSGSVEMDGTAAANVVIKWRAPSNDRDSQLTTRVVLNY